jgi:hypothetical protein
MRNIIKKILKESEDDFGWAREFEPGEGVEAAFKMKELQKRLKKEFPFLQSYIDDPYRGYDSDGYRSENLDRGGGLVITTGIWIGAEGYQSDSGIIVIPNTEEHQYGSQEEVFEIGEWNTEEGDHFDGDLRNYDSLVQFIEEVTLSGGKPHTEHEDDIWDGL